MSFDELLRAIADAREELLKHKIEANTVILNGRKYGCLFEPGLRPSIFGMAVECDAAIPDRYDFIVQYREPEPLTNADRIRSMKDEELARLLSGIKYPFRDEREDYENALAWLKNPVEVER